jgi:hypothetical protein
VVLSRAREHLRLQRSMDPAATNPHTVDEWMKLTQSCSATTHDQAVYIHVTRRAAETRQ